MLEGCKLNVRKIMRMHQGVCSFDYFTILVNTFQL
jgi:hypothetical protein